MDLFVLEEKENCHKRCGEMYLTTKGRVVLHCSLCDDRFILFKAFLTHLLDMHLPDEVESMDADFGDKDCNLNDNHLYNYEDNNAINEQVEFLDISEDHKNSGATINFKNGNQQSIKEGDEKCTKDEVNCLEIPVKVRDVQNRLFPRSPINKSDRQPFTISLVKEEIAIPEDDDALREEEMPLSEMKKQKRLRLQPRRKVIKTVKKDETNSANLQSNTQTKNLEECVDIAKQKEQSNENLQIPTVVREVKTRIFPRSLLIPAEERKHKCPVCGKAFKDRHNMVHHLKRHSDNKDHKCPECDKRFYTTAEVRIHMRSHKGDRPFLCSMCGISYSSNSHLLDNSKRYSNKRYHKCEICFKLQIPTVTREVKTRVLPRSLLTPAAERKHKCPVCGAAFKDRHNMVHHLKRHSDNKDHKCPECDKLFYTTSEVRVHMRSHKGDHPFLCSVCGMSYTSKHTLLDHLNKHSNQRNHKCEMCEKAFFNKSQLKDHMYSHSSDRPFACEICPRKFKHKNALRKHLKIHENVREFKCKICDSGFNQRAGLFSHMKTAHKTDQI